MRKIPTVFERDWENDRSRVIDRVHPGCEWVLAGEGEATQKLDGTCCMVRGGKLYKRRELRQMDAPPPGFEEVDSDEVTFKRIGWVPVEDGPEDRWHREAILNRGEDLEDGTYELIGPKIQGNNPEKWPSHELRHHGDQVIIGVPRTFVGLRGYLDGADIEGIVFHHPDGRMAKIKGRDFGFKRVHTP